MKSSFKKIDKSTSTTRAFFGHPDLDAIFHNSLSKGHLFILQQDHPTTNYLSLLRYFVSSNYHQTIPTLIYDTNPKKWKYLISPLKKQGNDKNKKANVQQQKSQIAWRYDSMNINLSELVLSEQVKFLDLSKEVQNVDETLILSKGYPQNTLQQFYKQLQQDLMNCQKDQNDTRHKKLLLSSLPSSIYLHQNFPKFLQSVRCLTRSSHLSTLITVPPIIPQKVRQILLTFSDYYLQFGKIGQGYDHFCASFSILKQIQVGQINSKNRGVTIWGVKNKKKEMRIEALYEQVLGETIGDEGVSGNKNDKSSNSNSSKAKQSIQF